MKIVNFINPHSITRQNGFKWWLWLTGLLFVASIIIMIIIQLQSWQELADNIQDQSHYQKKQEQWQELVQEKQRLIAQEKIVKDNVELSKQINHDNRLLLTLLIDLPNVLAKQGALLTLVTINAPSVEFIVYFQENPSMQSFEIMQAHLPMIKGLKLSSLGQRDQGYQATFKGILGK